MLSLVRIISKIAFCQIQFKLDQKEKFKKKATY